jgi:hypothetical protein
VQQEKDNTAKPLNNQASKSDKKDESKATSNDLNDKENHAMAVDAMKEPKEAQRLLSTHALFQAENQPRRNSSSSQSLFSRSTVS